MNANRKAPQAMGLPSSRARPISIASLARELCWAAATRSG